VPAHGTDAPRVSAGHVSRHAQRCDQKDLGREGAREGVYIRDTGRDSSRGEGPFVMDTTRGSAEQGGDGRTDGARVVEEVGRQREGEACRQAADRLDQPAHKAVSARRRQGTQALARRRRRRRGAARGAGRAPDRGAPVEVEARDLPGPEPLARQQLLRRRRTMRLLTAGTSRRANSTGEASCGPGDRPAPPPRSRR
jgi:hypothetical protein